ncbi:MAG: hypothetical protein WEG36_01670 [Gemmatimonadota bacterium]
MFEVAERTPPEPVRVSPDGFFLLQTVYMLDGEQRVVIDRDTHEVIASQLSRANSRFLQSAWSPTSDRIAMYVQGAGSQESLYQLVIWDILADTLVTLEGPGTSITTTPKWSPDGDHITHVVERREIPGERDLYVYDLSEPTSPWLVAKDLTLRGGIAWSPTGDSIAMVTRQDPGALSVYADGNLTSTTQIARDCADCEIVDLDWSADGKRLLVAFREDGGEWVRLVEVSLEGVLVHRFETPEGEVTVPRYLPEENGVAFTIRRGVLRQTYHCNNDERSCARADPGESYSSSLFGGVSPRGDTLFTVRESPIAPPSLYAMNTADRSGVTATQSAIQMDTAAAAINWLTVRSSDGLPVHAFHWEAKRPPGRSRKAIIAVYGGPGLFVPATWDHRRQFILESGIDILLVVYRGHRGFGAALENAPGGDAARLEDLVSIYRHVREQIGVESDDIVLYGISQGAPIVALAAAREPTIRSVVLLSMTPARLPVPEPRTSVCAVLFQGSEDEIMTPTQGKAELERILGGAAVSEPCGHFKIFEGEPHIPNRPETMGEVAATLVTLLEDDNE